MSDQVDTVIIQDSGYVDDIEKHCETTPSTKSGTPLRNLKLVYIKEDSITYKHTQSYTGINKHSGKRWFRVDTKVQYCFKVRKLKDGKKYLYVWSIPTNRKVRNYPVELTVGELNFGRKLDKMVVDFCEKHIGQLPKYLEHLSDHDKIKHYSRPNHSIITGLVNDTKFLKDNKLSLRTSDPNDIMKRYLGPRYSKKLAGLLREKCSVHFLLCIRNLPEIFKTEWVVDYVRECLNSNPDSYFNFYSQVDDPSYMVEVVSVGFRRKLLDIFMDRPSTISDIFRLYRRIGVTRDTFKDYKDNLSLNYSELRAEHDRLSELARSIEDKNYTKPYELEPIPEKLSELGFRLPTSNKDLSDWSKHFNNCVSGYAREVSNKETLVLNWNDEVCLEIRNKKLIQFLGKYNEKVTPEKFWEGVDLLKLNGMIDSEPYDECWGYQPFPQKELVSQ